MTGNKRLLTDEELERLHLSALDILWNMGVKIEHEGILSLLEKRGAKVDYSNYIAKLPDRLVKETIEKQRKERLSQNDKLSKPSLPSMCMAGGGRCQLYYDDEKRDRRMATRDDLIKMLRLGESLSEVKGIHPPLIDSKASPKIEAIYACQLLIENVSSEKASGIELFFPEEVKYVAEIGEIYSGNPNRFLPAANCSISPLKWMKRILDLAIEKAKYHHIFGVPTMPIAGLNAPVTPAGVMVIGIAEILSGWVIAKAIDEQTPVNAVPITGVMDMSTGNVSFTAPETIIQDMGIYEVCKYLYGARVGVFCAYIDAKAPGMQAIYEKTFKQMANAQFAYFTSHDGSLSAGKVFSPTQLIVDIEMNDAICKLLKEVQVNEETMAVDVIKKIGWNESEYLSHNHTLKNFKEVLWFPKLLDRTEWKGVEEEKKKENQILDKAEERWKEALKKWQLPSFDESKRKAIQDVVTKAEKELL